MLSPGIAPTNRNAPSREPSDRQACVIKGTVIRPLQSCQIRGHSRRCRSLRNGLRG